MIGLIYTLCFLNLDFRSTRPTNNRMYFQIMMYIFFFSFYKPTLSTNFGFWLFFLLDKIFFSFSFNSWTRSSNFTILSSTLIFVSAESKRYFANVCIHFLGLFFLSFLMQMTINLNILHTCSHFLNESYRSSLSQTLWIWPE